MRKMAEEKTLPLCPRCGAPYRTLEYKTINGKTYVYAYHGKVGKKPMLCYLGPADAYTHVEQILSLDLKNLSDVDLIAVAFNAATLYAVRSRRLPAAERREAAERLRQLARDIEILANDLA